jgi:hypothetical protein
VNEIGGFDSRAEVGVGFKSLLLLERRAALAPILEAHAQAPEAQALVSETQT